MSCSRHPADAPDPTCEGCYPSGVGFSPPSLPTLHVERDTTPAPTAARDHMNEQILEQLGRLPLALERVEDVPAALEQLERFANWYAATAGPELVRVPLRLVSEASPHYISADELERVGALFDEGPGRVDVWLALVNLVHDVGRTLGVCSMRGEGLSASKLRAAAAGFRELVSLNQVRIEALRGAVRSLGLGSITRESQAREALEADDRQRREWPKVQP